MNAKVYASSLAIAFSLVLIPVASSQQFVSSHQVVQYSQITSDGILPIGAIFGVADFNSDGRLDFLSLAPAGNAVSALMLQDSHGVFRPKFLPSVPNGGEGSTVVADVNGDGHADIISVLPAPKDDHGDPIGPVTLSISLGNGDGTFHVEAPIDIGTSFDSFGTVFVHDVNGDGRPDILATTSDQYGDAVLRSFLNDGGGHFHAGPNYGGLTGGMVLAAGVFTGSGNADVVVEDNFKTQILLGHGNGSFTAGALYNYFPRYAAVADLNHDHRQDLVVVTADYTKILLGNGKGGFAISTIRTDFGLGSEVNHGGGVMPAGLYIADLNHDGFPDLVVPSSSSTQLAAVYYGRGNGTFSNPKVYNIGEAAGTLSYPTAFADFNGDGQIDALSGSPSAGFVLAPSDGHGGFRAPLTSLATNPAFIAKGDFNGDGIGDVATANQPICSSCSASVSVFLGTGKGYFDPPKTYVVPTKNGVLSVGDVNGDGKLDIVVTRSGGIGADGVYFEAASQSTAKDRRPVPAVSAAASKLANASDPDLSVLLGRGDGTFEPPASYSLLGPPASDDFNECAYLIDVNHDGKLDLIGDWGVALGNGNGTFAAPIALPAAIHGIIALAPGNFDGDGRPDLAVGTNTRDPLFGGIRPPSFVYVLSGQGNGHFLIKSKKSVSFVGSLTTADLNHDGLSDILYTGHTMSGNIDYTDLVVEINSGNWTFTSATHAIEMNFDLEAFPGVILTGDFNRDGIADVALFGNFISKGDVAVLRGVGNGVLSGTPQFYQGDLASGVVLDINGDGAPDIAGTSTVGIERLLNTGAK